MSDPSIYRVPGGLLDSILEDFDVPESLDDLRGLFRAWTLLAEDEALSGYFDDGPWYRSGGETFLATGRVLLSSGQERGLVGKAACAIGPPPSEQIALWRERAEQLCRLGVRVPRFFGTAKGIAYMDALDSPLPKAPERLLLRQVHQIGEVAAALDLARFAPVDFPRDLMLKQDDVFYVDFGSDLGGSGVAETEMARRQLASYLAPSQLDAGMSAYMSMLARGK